MSDNSNTHQVTFHLSAIPGEDEFASMLYERRGVIFKLISDNRGRNFVRYSEEKIIAIAAVIAIVLLVVFWSIFLAPKPKGMLDELALINCIAQKTGFRDIKGDEEIKKSLQEWAEFMGCDTEKEASTK